MIKLRSSHDAILSRSKMRMATLIIHSPLAIRSWMKVTENHH